MGKKGNKGSNGNADLKNRIEGFGNGPMPPPISDNFEDRLHSALAQDETFGEWYTNARASVDAMVTAFDDTVNAIADTIEDTVAAVVGDDDGWEPEPHHNKNQDNPNRGKKKKRTIEDDGERSETKWGEVVAAICDEGNLENFVLLVRSQCANAFEEKEVAGLLSEQLLKAEKSSNVLRVLYVMQAVEEGDLPVVMDVIREKCQAKLEKLKNSTFFRALATQVLGPGPPEKTEEEKKEAEKGKDGDKNKADGKEAAAQKPVDLLDMSEPAKPAASSSGQVVPQVDLLGSAAPASSPAAKVDLLDMSTPASAAPPRDLLSLDATPILQPTPAGPPAAVPAASSSGFGAFPPPAATAPSAPGFAAFPPAPQPQQSMGQWGAFQAGSASSAPAPASVPGAMGMFPKSGGNPMSQPFGTMPSTSGYSQGFGATPSLLPITSNTLDNFDPNPKPSIAGPPIFVTGTTSSSAKAHDPFANLSLPSMGQGAGRPMQSSMGGPKAAGGMPGNPSSMSRSGAGAAQSTGQKDPFQLDDILNTELAKMQVAT